MTMYKKMSTKSGDGIMIIAGSESPTKYPVGFSYMLGSIVYKVVAIVTKNSHEEMRRLIGSNGTEEIVSIETIDKDLRSYDCKVIEEVKTEGPKVEEVKIEEPKVEEVEIEKRKRGRPKKQK